MGIVYETTDISEMAMIESVLRAASIEYTNIGDASYGREGVLLKLAVPDENEADARAVIDDYFQSISGGEGAEKIVKEKALYCPECNSKDCVQTFWSMFTNTPKYKCQGCGNKFSPDA